MRSSAGDATYELRGMVEKPAPEKAPSEFAIMGRYVLTPDIFELLAAGKPGAGGEIQLTDALMALTRAAQDLRLRIRGHPLRPGRPRRVHLGANRLRLEAPGPGRQVASVPEVRYLTIVIASAPGWGSSSAGRALRSQRRGRGFKSLLLHHSVSRFSDMSENRSKSARVRAICDRCADPENALGQAQIGRIGQNLSRRDFPRS